MRAPTMPYVNVPGDNPDACRVCGKVLADGETWAYPADCKGGGRHNFQIPPGTIRPRIMARSGQLRGFDRKHAIWVFGFLPGSDCALAFGVSVDRLLWVKATRKTAKVAETWEGFATDLPPSFRKVISYDSDL